MQYAELNRHNKTLLTIVVATSIAMMFILGNTFPNTALEVNCLLLLERTLQPEMVFMLSQSDTMMDIMSSVMIQITIEQRKTIS